MLDVSYTPPIVSSKPIPLAGLSDRIDWVCRSCGGLRPSALGRGRSNDEVTLLAIGAGNANGTKFCLGESRRDLGFFIGMGLVDLASCPSTDEGAGEAGRCTRAKNFSFARCAAACISDAYRLAFEIAFWAAGPRMASNSGSSSSSFCSAPFWEFDDRTAEEILGYDENGLPS